MYTYFGIAYEPRTYEGPLDVIIELNGKIPVREYTNNYKKIGEYLKNNGYISNDISEEDLISYVEKHTSEIKVGINKITGSTKVKDCLIPKGEIGIGDEEGEIISSGEINPNEFKPSMDVSSPKFTAKAKTIIGIIQLIGSVLSIIIIIIIGIKYLISSVEERAEYKTTALLYIIGSVFLFCTVTIVRLLYDISSNLFEI